LVFKTVPKILQKKSKKAPRRHLKGCPKGCPKESQKGPQKYLLSISIVYQKMFASKID